MYYTWVNTVTCCEFHLTIIICGTCITVIFASIIIHFRFIATPVVHYLGVRDKCIVFIPNTFCEKVYQTISKNPGAERLEGLSKQLGWPSREVKKWFKNRQQQSKPSLIRKATESRYS